MASEGGDQSNITANWERRQALRGEEEGVFDLLAEVLTAEQWARVLKAPLELAARRGNKPLAQKLVVAGAETGKALHWAVVCGHGEIVDDLVNNGASLAAVDSRGMTPLHVAAREGETEMMRLFLLKGANIDALDNDKQTPVFLAVFHGHVAAGLALMAAGADVGVPCYVLKWSVAHAAARGGLVEILEALVDNGADVNAVDDTNVTPLHTAARFNKARSIHVLVEAGADINARSSGGRTPLHHAAFTLSHGALLALLRRGVDVNAQDENGETPLHDAAREGGTQGAADVVNSLLRSGADETILNEEGKAAADVIGVPQQVLLFQDEAILADEVDRVRELLANAPADRAWRRRGYLVLCRAHSDRVKLAKENGSGSKLGRTKTTSEAVGGSRDGAGVVAMVLGLQEEGIFRTIVGYL